MFVWFNGKVMPEEEAVFNINTPAFRYGQGFFTTTRIEEGVPLWLDEHIERLKSFANTFSFPAFPEEPVVKASRLIPFMNGISRGVLRIVVFQEGEDSRVFIAGEKMALEEVPPVRIALASFGRHSGNPLLKIKSLNYWENILAHEEAAKKGCYDALFLNEKGEVCETSRCNIFWVKGDTVYTPSVECGLLPGIGRKKVLAIISRENIRIEKGKFGLEELKKADEVFLTNSLRGIVAVGELEGAQYKKEGMVFLLKEKLMQDIREYIGANRL